MGMNGYFRFCYGITSARKAGERLINMMPDMANTLEGANMGIRGEVYFSMLAVTSVIGLVVSLLVPLFLIFVMLPMLFPIPLFIQIPVVIFLFLIFAMITPLGVYLYPGYKKGLRVKSIDKNVGYAVNYMSAMASADVTPKEIFKGLSGQELYGEIQTESAMIARDIDIFGKDLVKVLQRAMGRTPSKRFEDFLQGIVTTSNSGGSFTSYLMAKSEEYRKETRLDQKQALQTLGVMAESYVTVVVASPLFLIVLMAVMAMLGNKLSLQFLWIVALLIIPLSQFGFLILMSGSDMD